MDYEESILRMVHCMKHRGPDDQGYYIYNGNVTREHAKRSAVPLSPS